MNKAYKFRIYPNSQQQIMLAKTFGCVRFIYNRMLSDKIKYYEETKQKLNNTPAQYKKEFEWLKEVDSLALANAQMNLQTAYNNFFRSPKIGFPKFKSKKSNRRSYTTNCVNENIVIENGYLKLPKVGFIKLKQHRLIPSDYKLKSVTISQTPSGKYYASVLFEYESQIQQIEPKTFLGLDFSMHELYKDSNGNEPQYPRYYRQAEKKLAKEQRRLSKMQKGSKNRNKQRIKVAKLHEKVANQRKDFLHKQSKQITNAYDCVCIEDLDMKAMAQSLNFGKSVSDNGWGMFVTFLQYKLQEQGKQLIKVDKFFASSQTCSVCGYKNSTTRDLSVRVWDCPNCGTEMETVGKEFVREEIIFVKPKMYRRMHYIEVLKCVSCGVDETKDAEFEDVPKQVFVKAKAPEPMLDGSYCSPELLAHILYEKYVQAVPLHRQQKDYNALGAPILKASMCNWVMYSAKRYALPVFNEMKKRLLNEPAIHSDETRVQMINDPEKKTKGKSHRSQMWVYCSGKHAEKFMVLFEYCRTRKGENVDEFLDDYAGYVICDGYDAYNSLKNAKRCGCLAHARRRFINALPDDKNLLPTSEAAKAVAYINKIYELERSYENLEPDEIHKQRQELSKPVLDEFFAWLEKVPVSGNSNLAKAVRYALNEKKYLCRFLESPYVSVDNNLAESSVRPFTVGRKNFLFFDTPRGAAASALWYSLAVTACVNGLNVEDYFCRLLTSGDVVLPW